MCVPEEKKRKIHFEHVDFLDEWEYGVFFVCAKIKGPAKCLSCPDLLSANKRYATGCQHGSVHLNISDIFPLV